MSISYIDELSMKHMLGEREYCSDVQRRMQYLSKEDSAALLKVVQSFSSNQKRTKENQDMAIVSSKIPAFLSTPPISYATEKATLRKIADELYKLAGNLGQPGTSPLQAYSSAVEEVKKLLNIKSEEQPQENTPTPPKQEGSSVYDINYSAYS